MSTPDEVTAAIARARAAQPAWAALPAAERAAIIARALDVLPILIDRWGRKKENIWYPYADKTVRTLESSIKTLFGNRLARRLMR